MTTTRPHTNRDDVSELDRLREELQDGGYDGLYCTDERCGCGLDYLVACGEPINGDEGILEICKPAYKHTCIGEDCAYPCDGYRPEREGSCYGPSKNGPKRREREPNPLDRLREEYRNWWSATEGWTRLEGAQKADALRAALEAENERLRQALDLAIIGCLDGTPDYPDGVPADIVSTMAQAYINQATPRPTEGGHR